MKKMLFMLWMLSFATLSAQEAEIFGNFEPGKTPNSPPRGWFLHSYAQKPVPFKELKFSDADSNGNRTFTIVAPKENIRTLINSQPLKVEAGDTFTVFGKAMGKGSFGISYTVRTAKGEVLDSDLKSLENSDSMQDFSIEVKIQDKDEKKAALLEIGMCTFNEATASFRELKIFGQHSSIAAAIRPTWTTKAPVIDGVLDDECWKNAAVVHQFHLLKEEKNIDSVTVRLASDEKFLYMAFDVKNPSTLHFAQTCKKHDGPVTGDESFELFFLPGGATPWYRFMFTAFGIQSEQMNQTPKWFMPWQLKTRRGIDNWQAEAAIPLLIFGQCSAPEASRFNVCYNQITAILDNAGAKINQEKKFYTFGPLEKSTLEFGNWSNLKIVNPPANAFLPAISEVQVTGYSQKDGKKYYNLYMKTQNYGNKDEECELLVDDGKIHVLTIPAAKNYENTFQIPVAEFAERKIKVSLRDKKSQNVLAESDVNTKKMCVIEKVVTEFNYYTTEKDVQVKFLLSMPEDSLKPLSAKISIGNTLLGSTDNLKKENIITFPAEKIPVGKQRLKLELFDGQRLFASKTFALDKLAPNPGREVKIDQFHRCLIKDGKRIFPFSAYGEGDIIDGAHELSFNDALINFRYTDTNNHYSLGFKDVMDQLAKAERHGMLMGVGGNKVPPTSWTVKQVIDNFKKLRPQYEESLQALKQSKNLLYHYGSDEPNLWGNRMELVELYHDLVREIDPYHPILTVYCGDIPGGTEWADIISMDPYLCLGRGLMNSHPVKLMDYACQKLIEAIGDDNKVMMVVPVSSHLDSWRTPIMVSSAQQRCQSYAALIYGAKGLLYFAWTQCAADMAETFKQLAAEVKTFAPALLTGELKQQITQEQKSLIRAALFRDEENGDYLFLAVNGNNYPAKVTFDDGFFKDVTAVKGLFGGATNSPAVKNGFTDLFQPYAAHAYRLSAPVVADIAYRVNSVKAGEPLKEIFIPDFIKATTQKKNVMANPLFKLRSASDKIPDFFNTCGYNPYLGNPDSEFYIDSGNKWDETPSLRIRHGQPYLEEGRYNRYALSWVTAMFYAPVHATPTEYTFSFYAKAEKPGDAVTIYIPIWKKYQKFVLTDKWQRYNFSGKLHEAKSGAMYREDGWVWIFPGEAWTAGEPCANMWLNGFQLEKGDKPTEFTEK